MVEIEGPVVIKGRRRFFVMGPPIALFMFAQALTATVLTDLIVYRTCLVSLNMSQSECLMLHTNASSPDALIVEAKVEPYASMIVMTKSLLESVPPALLSLFLGPWSDRGGRRPLLLSGFTGFTIMNAMLSLMCNWDISPWYLLIPSLPAYMMGGFCAIILASICHISDTTEEKDRTMLLSLFQASILSGIVLGVFTGPLIYGTYGYTTTFSTASICCILALIYTYFCVPETVRDTSKESIFGLFKISFVKELVTSSFVNRVGFHRSVVWLSITVVTVCIMVVEGEVSIGFLFTRERLGWDVQHYSYYSGASILINMIGVLCGVSLLSRGLGLSDTLVTIIALVSALGCAITKSFAYEAWHLYLSSGLGLFSGVVGPVMRSIISKSVPAQDLGKVFSFTASMETLSPLGGAPLYTLIYSHFLPPIYPAPVYLVSASFFVILIIITVCIALLIRRSHNTNYGVLVQDE